MGSVVLIVVPIEALSQRGSIRRCGAGRPSSQKTNGQIGWESGVCKSVCMIFIEAGEHIELTCLVLSFLVLGVECGLSVGLGEEEKRKGRRGINLCSGSVPKTIAYKLCTSQHAL